MTELLTRLNAGLRARYAVMQELDSGGTATVYLAEDVRLRSSVVLKLMELEITLEPGSDRLGELDVAAHLTHPNILPFLDFGEVDGLLYLIMPYLEGDTLRERLEREGTLPLDEAARIAGEVGDALGYAHLRGLVHADVKPENILLHTGRAVVSGFGVARAVGAAGTRGRTKGGPAIGTPQYMSPEQVAGESDVGTRSDVYSLGCVLYEMLSGSPPFTGAGDRALLARKLTEPPPPLEGAGAKAPPSVQRVVRKALASDPADRYAGPGDLAHALRKAVGAGRVDAPARRRRWARESRSTVVVAATLVFGAVVWWVSALVRSPAIGLVAALPLQAAVDQPGQDVLAGGLHVTLLQELSRAGVRVIGPTSVMRYRDGDRPADEVARELGADGVIEGSTALVGDSVTLDLRMMDGDSGELLWSGSFDAPLSDVTSLLADAARSIAGSAGVHIGGEVDERLAGAPPVDPDVIRPLLRARFHRSRRSEPGLASAIDDYELVLTRDPDNAEAFAGLASVWSMRGADGYISVEEARARGGRALQAAVQIDSTLAEVQRMLAERRAWGAWDWTGGERSFRRALAADPTSSAARACYSQLLDILGRHDEAALEIGRAVREDPFHPEVRTLQAVHLNYVHEYEEAEAVLRDVLTRTPEYRVALSTLGTTYHLLGRHDDALETWRASNARDPGALAALDRGYVEAGYSGALRSLAELWISRSGTASVPPWQIGTLYARAGDADLALDYLERAFEERDPNVPSLNVDPVFDDLRDEPRFGAMIRSLGLPE